MQCARTALKNCVRSFNSSSTNTLELLKNRSLLQLTGKDSAQLLQGLITNDISHLYHGAASMYGLFLNNKGRVLYDTIIYKSPKSNHSYLLEVDTQVVDEVKNHLKLYCLRRKVDISSLDDQYKLWVYFDSNCIEEELIQDKNPVKEDIESEDQILPRSSADKIDNQTIISENVDGQEFYVYQDPRLKILGKRIIASIDGDVQINSIFRGKGLESYKRFRYILGVGEGVDDLPPGNCFPLEANGDYLHGVSFHKGCYIGQELTARTHHTGVVRKRLMPLILKNPFEKFPEKDEIIRSGKQNIGKLRGVEKNSGLALLRITEALDANELLINDNIANTIKPKWWPEELRKEKLVNKK